MKKEILAIIVFQDIGLGFYGIIDEHEKRYYPLNLPEEYKKDGKRVKLTIEEKPDVVTEVMWGIPVMVIE